MKEFSGLCASEGYALGKAFIYRHDTIVVSHGKIGPDEVEKELKSLSDAFSTVIGEKKEALEHAVNEEEKALYTVEILMLEDPEYRSSIERLIMDSRYNASFAIEEATGDIVDTLNSSEDEYFRERILDIRDIERNLLETVTGKKRTCMVLSKPSIIVSDNILTSELISFKGYSNLLGIAIDAGGRTSHVAILAKNRGIPMIVGLENFSLSVSEGQIVALDAYKGKAYSELNKKASLFFESRIDRMRTESEILKTSIRNRDRKTFTKDGHRLILEANIEDLRGLEDAIGSGCEGIGLFRTEFISLKKEKYPKEEDRAKVYCTAASRIKDIGGYVTFRTLDVGGDKKGDEFEIPEENPILGWRAVRYCLGNPEVFSSQIRSILRASRSGNVRIMFPLISGIEDLDACMEIFEKEKEAFRKEGVPFDEEIEVGTMIEVPSAAITSDILAKKVDFFSVGTNDLVQYLMAVDRGNERVQSLYRPYHPAVIRIISEVIGNAHAEGVRVGICGQLASDLEAIPLLVGLGFDELSVSPHSLLFARSLIEDLDSADCRKLANNVLSMRSYVEIEKAIKEFNDERETRNKK